MVCAWFDSLSTSLLDLRHCAVVDLWHDPTENPLHCHEPIPIPRQRCLGVSFRMTTTDENLMGENVMFENVGRNMT